MTYFFILGNNPSLSIVEILNVLFPIKNKVEKFCSEFLILKTEQLLEIEELQNRLGGTIKIGKVLQEIKRGEEQAVISEVLKSISQKTRKVCFGFSVYYSNKEKKEREVETKDLAMRIKEELKRENINSRWVESTERVLSSVIVKKNRLLTQGAELVFLVIGEKIYLGQTISCQEFEEYSDRDFLRPNRDIEQGMIPPKLARIMLNLNSIKRPLKNLCFLDPFCGTGTFLQEAFLMNYGTIMGADKNKRAILDAQKNLNWLAERTNRLLNNVKIFHSDVRKISKKIRNNSVSLIATEPYLGPLKIKTPVIVIKKLSSLYLLAFKEFEKILKPDGQVVIIFPVFKIDGKEFFLPILDQLKGMGWQREDFLPKFLLKNKTIRITKRNSIVYSRPGQRILREIFIFKRR